MLKVELYQSIRNAVSKEDLSIRATAKEFKVHRREVRRALASATTPDGYRVKLRSRSQLSHMHNWPILRQRLKISDVNRTYETKLPGVKNDVNQALLAMNELEVATADKPIPTVLKLHI